MPEEKRAENPRGRFDRSTRGAVLPPVTVTVERGRIAFFAKSLGETDPVHFDVEAARRAGYPDVVAPPSFFMAIEAMANEECARRGEATAPERVKCDFRYLLHGDETYSYPGLVFAGDEVTLSTRIVDFYDKKGGDMEFVTIEYSVSHAERGELVRATRNLLHRLPAGGA
jgi:acyl dehydratase